MSYGQPWSRIAGGPPARPDSAQAVSHQPGRTCFICWGTELIVFAFADRATPEGATASASAAIRRNSRRSEVMDTIVRARADAAHWLRSMGFERSAETASAGQSRSTPRRATY